MAESDYNRLKRGYSQFCQENRPVSVHLPCEAIVVFGVILSNTQKGPFSIRTWGNYSSYDALETVVLKVIADSQAKV